MIVLRPMTREDITSALVLCRHANWNQVSWDWDTFLRINARGCRVAQNETGTIVGTFTTVTYENRFSWIGMVLVHPLFRRQGIGTQLLTGALSLLPDDITAKLDATPAGREVYLKLKFIDEYNLIRMQRASNFPGKTDPSTSRPMKDEDFVRVMELDREVFGADRKFVLMRNFESAPNYALVTEKGREITGFILGRRGHRFDQIGPIIAENLDEAMQLLNGILARVSGKELIIDASQHTPEWIEFLSSQGFYNSRPLIRMFRGSNSYAGHPEKQFAILGPEFG